MTKIGYFDDQNKLFWYALPTSLHFKVLATAFSLVSWRGEDSLSFVVDKAEECSEGLGSSEHSSACLALQYCLPGLLCGDALRAKGGGGAAFPLLVADGLSVVFC
jgi:hypothetical protein